MLTMFTSFWHLVKDFGGGRKKRTSLKGNLCYINAKYCHCICSVVFSLEYLPQKEG